jgi:hypothetical protein
MNEWNQPKYWNPSATDTKAPPKELKSPKKIFERHFPKLKYKAWMGDELRHLYYQACNLNLTSPLDQAIWQFSYNLAMGLYNEIRAVEFDHQINSILS